MPSTKNGTVLYIAPANGTHMTPDVNVKYVEQTIDLDNIPLYGGVLLKALALSVDPYLIYRMRDPEIESFVPPFVLNEPVENFGIGKVLRSDDARFKPGDYVHGNINFQEYSVYPAKPTHVFKVPLSHVDKVPGVPWSVFTGTLGMPGMTAYSGLKTFAAEKVQTSKTLFVSGGAGPVGTFVIAYAKILAPHLKVIASAGSEEKVRIMKKAGADVAFNYKTTDTAQVLREHGPLDIYWDNVAGPTLDAVLMNINAFGLIIACGAASAAVGGSIVKNFEQVFMRSLTINGFVFSTGPSAKALPTFFDEIVPLLQQNKIVSFEQRYDGLAAAGNAMQDLHTGMNTGKAAVIVADD